MHNPHELWQSILAEFELKLSKANFTTWFKNTGIKNFEEGEVIVCVPNNFTKAWLEKKYHHDILKTLERLTKQPVKKIEYRVENFKKTVAEEELKTTLTQTTVAATVVIPQPDMSGFATTNLNPKYTFSTFIIGKGTELAAAAARAVADNPGNAYNPLFVYGSVCLGKTHLLQAIGNGILKQRPDMRILYTTIEKFKNDLVEAVRSGNPGKVKNTYRNVDVLLIDDVQFISGKEGTQEELFHTFNHLHQQNKQVILSSDRPPKAIPALEARLRSRFEWGMIVDVTAPDLETRAAIIKAKAKEKNLELSDDIVITLATTIQNNVRELEGAINKITAYHQLKGIEPSVETIKAILINLESQSARRSVTPKTLIRIIGEFYDVDQNEILGKNREKRLSFPRQVIMFLLREDLKLSFPAIGTELGGRDHTTAMHAHQKIRKEVEDDLKLKNEVELIRQRLYNTSG